jgi:hypothetical protein
MLPGFRFLCAAIVLSMSILIFGLGAAALLRVAHEEFSSTPFWRAAPETQFAQRGEATNQAEATKPVLATLRVNALPAEQEASDDLPTAAEPAATESVPAEPEQMAALKAEDSLPPEPATPEIPVSEILPQSEAVPAEADAPASAAADGPRVAASEQVSAPPNEAVPASDHTSLPALPEADIIGMKIASMDDPTVALEATPQAKAASTKPEQSEIKKRLQARRVAERRRMAARARAAHQAAQQLADPFSQLAAQPAVVARSR